MTLEEIAQIKHSSVEDIRIYMRDKGIELTDASNAQLSPSMVKLIDPILYFNLRKSKSLKKNAQQIQADAPDIKLTEIQTPNETTKDIIIDQPQKQGMKLSKAGHYFGQSWDNIADYLQEIGQPLESIEPKTRLTDIQYDSLKEHFGVAKKKRVGFDDVLIVDESRIRYVGKVQFYDGWTNYFGYLSTNKLQGKVVSLRFGSTDCKGGTPDDNDIVLFVPIYKGKPHATKVEVINYRTPIEWRNILRYTGEYADIDSEVQLKNVIGSIITKTNGNGLIETLFEIIDQLEEERKTIFIQTYLSNQSISDYLYKCYTKSENLYAGDSAQRLFDALFKNCQDNNNSDKCNTLLKLNSNLLHDDLISTAYGCKLFVETGNVKFLANLGDSQEDINMLVNEITNRSTNSQRKLLILLLGYLKGHSLTNFIHTYLQNEQALQHITKHLIIEDDEICQNTLIQQTVLTYLEQHHTLDDISHLLLKYPHLANSYEMSDELLCQMFVLSENTEYLYKISDTNSISSFLPNLLQQIETDKRYQLLKLLDKEVADKIVLNSLENTELFNLWVSELWDAEKAKVPYTVFDLETDGESIQQFAFTKENEIQIYESEELLTRLARAIKKQPIVVGHKIKTWDLPILERKGITTKAFIWDTIEIEALLNPCRYAYALHTAHNAKDDTALTDKLFWNQLYRLSQNSQLCNDLRNFLPKEIDDILASLQKPYFQKLFANDESQQIQFFEDLLPLDSQLISELKQINEIPSDEKALIIAPRQLWNRLARYVLLSFPTEATEEYHIINQYVIPSLPISDFQKCFLQRYIQESATPLIGNIATYLRTADNTSGTIASLITNDIIGQCAIPNQNNRICIDIDSFENEEIINADFQHIYIIGSELQDRLHKCKIAEFTFADFIAHGSKLLLTMASVNYAPIDETECEQLGIKRTSLTANTWIERENNKFVVFQNYEYQKYRNAFLDNFAIRPTIIEWRYDNEVREKNKPFVVGTERKQKFDSSIYRMTPSTNQRAKYWLYQLALLKQLQQVNDGTPIIYIINDLRDYDNLIQYATSQGFYVPPFGSKFRKLEYIQNRKNGLVIISKEQFIKEIGTYYTGDAALYVWDNLDIDRCQMMWNKLPFDRDLQDEDETQSGVTVKQCILAQWAVMEQYYAQILANNHNSKFCIIDPSFEEVNDIANLCKAEYVALPLWNNADAYDKDRKNALEYFPERIEDTPQLKTLDAINSIRKIFIDGHELSEYQANAMPHILEKRGNSIISIPTGGGKSVLFQGPAIYRAAYTHKLTLVVSPLRALMQDQVEGLQKKGFYTNVDYLSSDKTLNEIQHIYRRIASGEIALLYITPERFRVRSFMNILMQRMTLDNGLEYIVFDEAHCISQWGQDFRPDYRNALQKCVELQQEFPFDFAFFSATFTSQVEEDIRKYVSDITRLGQPQEDYNPIRNHISISFQECGTNDDERVKAICEFIKNQKVDFDKSRMIVFCRKHQQCEETADSLNILCSSSDNPILSRCKGHIGYFHAGLDAEQRNDIYERFKSNATDRFYILCSTKAFGMGMDIPNIHYVVHFNPTSVVEDYLQEVGRAGRDMGMYQEVFGNRQIPACCLYSREDFQKLKDLLIKSQLSWSDLKEARDAALKFIKKFKTLEQAKTDSIVIPYSFWQRSSNTQDLNDTTSTKLALHWLERIGYIRQGYIGLAQLQITRLRDEIQQVGYYSRSFQTLNPKANDVWKYIKGDSVVDVAKLFSIKDMQKDLHLSTSKLINSLIQCQQMGLLRLDNTIRTYIRPRRYWETKYMFADSNSKINALSIVFDGLREMLGNCKIGDEKIFTLKDRQELCKHLLDNISIDAIIEKDSNNKEVQYMPWKNIANIQVTGAVLKVETFTKNIRERAGHKMFLIASHIKGINVKRTNNKNKEDVVITVKNTDWKEDVNKLQQDCLRWLSIANKNQDKFPWVKQMIDSDIRSYQRLTSILEILYSLSYIDYTPPIGTGVELYTTDISEKEWSEGQSEEDWLYSHRQNFDDEEKMKKIRLATMNVYSTIDDKEKQSSFIHQYFLCQKYQDYLSLAGEYCPSSSTILQEISEEALRKREEEMLDNADQWAIYQAPIDENINVLAGPGSGKTHVLTMRCARLIYKEHVEPSQILVLAYNRAVVAELKNRLNNLFTALGMSRIAHQLNVYTFHALAKRALGNKLDNVDIKQWESKLYDLLTNSSNDFRQIFPNIRFVLIDEFQDITQTRLDSILQLNQIYPNIHFFTIGDINQSIYGFERTDSHDTPELYARKLDPRPYYDKLEAALHCRKMEMFTNYRSYQKILDAACVFIPKGDTMPKAAEKIMLHEPIEPYVHIFDNTQEKKWWYQELPHIIDWAKQENESNDAHHHIANIAIFFRTNSEVYRGFSQIKKQIKDDNVRIRIQGASNTEFWRQREVYHIIGYLQKNANQCIEISNNNTKNRLKGYIESIMNQYTNWDKDYLDVTYTIILNYLDTIRTDENIHTYAEIADYIIDIAGRDDGGQIYKIYDNYSSERILQDKKLTIVLTTIHKVKGLEFDVVVITPSFADLPLGIKRRQQYRTYDEDIIYADDQADIGEEKRLLFVAYTRAKKRLYVYKWQREMALEKQQIWNAPENSVLRYTEKEVGLDKYFISFTASDRNSSINQYIQNNVSRDDEINVIIDQNNNYCIEHKGRIIGRLSSKNNIALQMWKNGLSKLCDFFISDIVTWTFRDTEESDKNNNTDFQKYWGEQARQQGYVYVVQIAGFGKPA